MRMKRISAIPGHIMQWWNDCKAELDEKAVLTGLYVLAAIAGLAILGTALGSLWNHVSAGF